MRPIPLNLQTLYADLVDQVSAVSVRPASISRHKSRGKVYLYATFRDGQERVRKSLGPADDPNVQEMAEQHRTAEQQAKQRRSTIRALKQQRMLAPPLQVGRILETVANAGLFDQGIVLIGTHAYRMFPCVLGCFLPNAALVTNDVDVSTANFVADDETEDLGDILKRADKSFSADWSRNDAVPKRFKASNGLTVDVLTRLKRGGKSPVPIKALGIAAEALPFQEYLVDETMDAVALYGTGVMVRIPTPARYAVHKLIVAGRRGPTNPKSAKDLRQAQDLIEALIEIDDAALEDALEDARSRGRNWKTAVNASLRTMNREFRQGRLPLRNH